ncbi:MAG TPA: phytoene desaturase family protein [Bacteroidales bacterium]|nr:phytoene desaturase family protein [Bacteroidales bacterium]
MTTHPQHHLVIGAGFSGLAAAATLARSGKRVTLIEKHSQPGGRARTFSEQGFTYDMGPSWYWLPDVFEQYFAGFGRRPSDYYSLVRLDPSYRVYYGKDDFVDLPASQEGVEELFERMEAGAGARLHHILEEAKFKYELGIGELVRKPANSWLEYLSWPVISGSLRLNVFRSVFSYYRKNFRNPRLYPILEFPMIFLGATPRKTPALYTLMNYADISLGTWYPMGGMGKVVDGMVELAREAGVEFRMGEQAERMMVRNGRVAGVVTASGEIPATGVIATADYQHVEAGLLPEAYRRYDRTYWESRDLAPSALLYYLGIDQPLPQLLHHNLLMDESFDRHAEELFEDARWPEKPLVYVSCTSRTDPTVAPAGMENMVILIPVAPGLEDTDEVRERYYRYALEKLKAITGVDLEGHVVYRRDYSQRDFSRDYHAYRGNAYGLGNTLMQTAVLKPRMKSRLPGLWFAGQMTTPGPGVPPSIISGQVAAEQLLKAGY